MQRMRMLNTGSSPWSTRVRMVLYAKGKAARESVELMMPGGPANRPVHTEQFRFGRTPTLWIGDEIIQESMPIMDYFDELFPEPPLKPADAKSRAKMWMLCHIAEGSIMTPLQVLFPKRDPALTTPELIQNSIRAINDGFDRLEYYMSGDGFAFGNSLTLADCVIVPIIWHVFEFLLPHKAPLPLLTRPKCAAYWEAMKKHPVAAEILPEMDAHVASSRAAKRAEQEAQRAQSN